MTPYRAAPWMVAALALACGGEPEARPAAGSAPATDRAADRPVILKMTEDFRKSQFKFKELIVSLMLSREYSEGTVHVASNH